MTTVPPLGGLHHLALTVSDAERSARWYCDVLGFELLGRLGAADGAPQKVFLGHARLTLPLALVEHRVSTRAAPGEAFDETACGLDHLAFGVATVDELERWARRLDDLGVVRSPIAPSRSIPGARVLVFRDPDRVQLELFRQP